MRIATHNVNDVRKRIASSSAWLAVTRPDIAFSDNTLLQPAARCRPSVAARDRHAVPAPLAEHQRLVRAAV
jgi:hypothetical protein